MVEPKSPNPDVAGEPTYDDDAVDYAAPIASAELVQTDRGESDPASNEIQFALVIARMIDTVQTSPEHMRQAVYDLARYKLQEQFTHADAKDIRRTQQALESAIRGVEEFSKQQIAIPPPSPAPQLTDSAAPPLRSLPAPNAEPPAWAQTPAEPVTGSRTTSAGHWPLIRRTAAMLAVVAAIAVGIQQRERLVALVQNLSRDPRHAFTAPQPAAPPVAAPVVAPPKPNPLRPTDYGVYAVNNESLVELQLLPGRAPDIRVAVSAAIKATPRPPLPNGHPKFIVFRRDAATSISDRAEVRVVAKIAREFSADVAGKRPEDGDTWVIRNVSFPFRASPIPDSPEMFELHSEDPALELTPGRYALILKAQSYDFSVEGTPVDPKQCIERIVAANGTFYTDCKKP